jgi:predicted AAA+ superfamily ATPase
MKEKHMARTKSSQGQTVQKYMPPFEEIKLLPTYKSYKVKIGKLINNLINIFFLNFEMFSSLQDSYL